MWAKVKRALTRKFGVGRFKLPAWAWLAIIGGGIFLYMRRRASAGQGLTDMGLPVVPPDTGAGYGDAGLGGAAGGGSGGSLGGPLPPVDQGPVSFDPGQVGGDLPPLPPLPDVPGGDFAGDGGAPIVPAADNTTPATAAGPATARQVEGAARKSITVTLPGGGTFTFSLPAWATNVRVLPNGALIWEGPSGATIEQAPGGNPYRVSTGSISPAGARPVTGSRATAPPRPSGAGGGGGGGAWGGPRSPVPTRQGNPTASRTQAARAAWLRALAARRATYQRQLAARNQAIANRGATAAGAAGIPQRIIATPAQRQQVLASATRTGFVQAPAYAQRVIRGTAPTGPIE